MSLKKYFSLFNIKDQIIDSIETFNVDPQAMITNEDKRRAATELTDVVSKLNAAISLQPIPIADFFLLTPIQVSLVIKIARIYGKDIDDQVIQESIVTIIKGLLARTFTRSLLKFIPFFGAPVSFFTSYIVTQSIGITAIKLFENNQEIDIDAVKEVFEKEYNSSEPVNIVISTAVSISKSSKGEALSRRMGLMDLKSVEEETRNTIIYLPNEN
jgi:GTP-binding protein Era